MKDSLTACPAGDSVYYRRPARLRISVFYSDIDCNPRVGVPPESIWAQVFSYTGNLTVNDEGAKSSYQNALTANLQQIRMQPSVRNAS